MSKRSQWREVREMGNKSKAAEAGMVLGAPLSMAQWEVVADGLLRIIEVQGKSIEALAKALEVMGGVVVPGGGGDEEGGEGEAAEEEGGGEGGAGVVAKG